MSRGLGDVYKRQMPFSHEKLSEEDWLKYSREHRRICEAARKEFLRVHVAKVVAAKYNHDDGNFIIVTVHRDEDDKVKQNHLSVDFRWLKRFVPHSEVHDLMMGDNPNRLISEEGFQDISEYAIPVYFYRGYIKKIWFKENEFWCQREYPVPSGNLAFFDYVLDSTELDHMDDTVKERIKENELKSSSEVAKFLGSFVLPQNCLLYTSPSPRDKRQSRMPSSA